MDYVEFSDLGMTRRRFLRLSAGVAALGVLGAEEAWAKVPPTEKNILGPYYRPGAPFRSKLATAKETGEVLIVRGRVMSTDEQPLKNALVDVWQADAQGRYDNMDPNRPPAADEFILRGRMKVEADGRYEFETVLPGAYAIENGQFRPKHIHYMVSCPGYTPLVTQLYFSGDPYLKTDPFQRPSLVIDLKKQPAASREKKGYLAGAFDIALARPDEAPQDRR